GAGAGARGRQRDSEEPRADGRHRPEEGGEGHDPGGFCGFDRRQRGARLRRARDGKDRDRVLLPGERGALKVNEAVKTNLLGLDAGGLARFFEAQGEKPFRARQLQRWIHQLGASEFAAMSDLSKALRDKLSQSACVAAPSIVGDETTADGTRKWLVKVDGANAVESVFIPETGRATLCVSSQAGCVLDCSFCATGKQGFNRNLSAAEIVGQLWLANRELGSPSRSHRIISNVVFMGMGEPLLNLDNVIPAVRLMIDDNAYGLSRRRVTVSTSGVVPGMDRLRDECPVALAVSLHAPNDRLRDE